MPASWVSLAGAALGAVSSLDSGGGGGGGGSTTSKEPWLEAAPWLKEQIAKGQGLQAQYEKNPFNPQQQQAYNNTFQDINSLRQNVVPTINNVANNMVGQNYQRAPQRGGFNGGAASGGAFNGGASAMLPGGNGGISPLQQQPQYAGGLMSAMGGKGGAPGIPQGSAPAMGHFGDPTYENPNIGLFSMPFGPGGNASPYPVVPAPAPAPPPAPGLPPGQLGNPLQGGWRLLADPSTGQPFWGDANGANVGFYDGGNTGNGGA